jgi:8-oxo-dGTP diphosphatase
MSKKIIDCVAFILIKENKMLVEKRKLTKRIDPGKVCIPSGGVEKGETPEQAVKREVKEEFSIDIKKASFIGSLVYPCPEVDFLIKYFVIKEWEGEIENLEADKIFWIEISEGKVDVWPDKVIVKAITMQDLNCD